MPGSDSEACSIDSNPTVSTRFASSTALAIQPNAAVVDRHERERQQQADAHRVPAALDVVLAEARTDRPLLDDRLRCGERAGAQQQRQLACFGGLQAGDAEAATTARSESSRR